jgi:5-oxoprolinase (ATP-hydrolysing)
MCRPIRSLTEGRGLRTSDHCLAIFGGAGGQHACSVAEALDIDSVIVHHFSSILSAYGMALADVAHEIQRPRSANLGSLNSTQLQLEFDDLIHEAVQALQSQGFASNTISTELYLNLRYLGTDSSLMIRKPENGWDFARDFIDQHQTEFGFTLSRDIWIEDIRVRGVAKSAGAAVSSPFEDLEKAIITELHGSKSIQKKRIYFEAGWIEAGLFKLDDLTVGDRVQGPAVILDQTQTIVVSPNWQATALRHHLFLENNRGVKPNEKTSQAGEMIIDPIQLSVFGHRFMSIAEQMGRTLQKTSVSVNIKERLDYSCAIFSPSGGLVANAPHIPCHLGAMSYAVAYQAELWGNKLRPGDVLVSNHPIAGGSHLPDITVITPVIDENTSEVLFWAASRGHHADIGGISAGSMPPFSKEIWQEGASFISFKLVDRGVFDEDGLADIMLHKPAQHPGCSGTRTWADNVSDLKAQVAANAKGIMLIKELIAEYGLSTVQVRL